MTSFQMKMSSKSLCTACLLTKICPYNRQELRFQNSLHVNFEKSSKSETRAKLPKPGHRDPLSVEAGASPANLRFRNYLHLSTLREIIEVRDQCEAAKTRTSRSSLSRSGSTPTHGTSRFGLLFTFPQMRAAGSANVRSFLNLINAATLVCFWANGVIRLRRPRLAAGQVAWA